jgi:pimeloyl-ACP methyl ester carboxylesterase
MTPSLLSAGPGKPLLVVGAGLGTGVRALWGAAVPYLGDFEVVGVDLPGHGSSPAGAGDFTVADLARAVAAVVGRLQTGADDGGAGEAGSGAGAGRKVFYAGVSLAGAVGLQLGLDYADQFSAVATICSAAQFGEPQGWLDRAETVARQGTPTQVVGSAQRWFAPGFMQSHPDRAAGLLHTLQDADRFSYAAACRALAAVDLRGRLSEMRVPVLALAGELDTVYPPAVAESVAAAVLNGRAGILPGAAHQGPLEAPAETAEQLCRFFL